MGDALHGGGCGSPVAKDGIVDGVADRYTYAGHYAAALGASWQFDQLASQAKYEIILFDTDAVLDDLAFAGDNLGVSVAVK